MWKSAIAFMAVAVLTTACSDSQSPAEAQAQASVSEVDAGPAVAAPATEQASDAPQDGELAFPDGYTQWAVFLSGIQKPDTKQIRDIYLNTTAEGASAGAPLPDGSVLVMEIYAAQTTPEGEAVLDAEGNLQKGGLSKIFVMEKNAGWGGGAAVENGSWVYSAFEANGERAEVEYATCRACHVPSAAQDFVPRLDEYLAQR